MHNRIGHRFQRRIDVPVWIERGPQGLAYYERVLATQPGNLIAYWPLWEVAGGVADNLEGTAARDGAYIGVTLGQPGIGDGNTCPLFDGTNDFVNIYSASLNTAWAQTDCAIMIWAKVFDAGVWTDGSWRRQWTLRADGTNRAYLAKNMAVNNIFATASAGGVSKFPGEAPISTLDWMCWVLLLDEVANTCKLYRDGVIKANIGTYTGTWVGNLDLARTCIGSGTTAPADPWYGWLAHMAIWSGAGSAAAIEAQVVGLATV